MSDFLSLMLASSRSRVREAKARVGESALLRRSSVGREAPRLRLPTAGFDVIAEIKMRSPSRGRLDLNGARRAEERGADYARAGAAAVSVVTEPYVFAGSLEALSKTALGCGCPTMRKDFLVDPYQVIEAKAHGAAGVLLITRALLGGLLGEMLAAAGALNLFALLEAFDADDLERGVKARGEADGVVLFGVNARDLKTLALEPARHADLARSAPSGVPLVAESGIATPDDAARVARLGYRAALAGEALMRLDDPGPLLLTMIASGREAAAEHDAKS